MTSETFQRSHVWKKNLNFYHGLLGGNSDVPRHAPLDHADRVEEGKPVGVFFRFQGGLVHQAADRIVRHQQSEELLLYQFWRLAAQHDRSAAQMRFQLVKGGFDLPPFVIQGRQFFSRGLLGVEDGGDQPVQRLGTWDRLQAVLEDTYGNSVAAISPVCGGSVDVAEVGAVWQAL